MVWKKLFTEKGMTLLEIMAVIFIFLTILFSTYTVFKVGISSWVLGNELMEINQNARYGLLQMVDSIRAAKKEDITLISNSHIRIGEQAGFRQYHTDLRNWHNSPIASNIKELNFSKVKTIDNKREVVPFDSIQWDIIKIELIVEIEDDKNIDLLTYVKPRN